MRVCTQRCRHAGQDLRHGHTDVSPKRLRIRAAVNSVGLQITGFDYKEQIYFKAWFACLVYALFPFCILVSQTVEFNAAKFTCVYTSGLAFRFFRLPLIRVNTYLP